MYPADSLADINTMLDTKSLAELCLSQNTTQYSQAGSGTADGPSWTIPAGMLVAGKGFVVKAAGTLTGGNAAPTVHLYLKDGQVLSLTFPAATAGDWVAEFMVLEYTDTAHQKIYGRVDSAAGAGGKADYAAATKDVSAAATLKLQIQSANAGDTITCEMATLELLP